MKFSRILIVGLLSASCSDSAVTDQQALTSDRQGRDQQTGTTGDDEAEPQPAPAGRQSTPAPAAPAPKAPVQTAVDQPAGPRVNADAASLVDFKRRVDAYMKLRKEAIKGAPSLKETEDAANIKAAQDGMATQIRAARVHAKHGDIFTKEIAAQFRRLLSPELKGDDGRDAKAIIKDDAPTNVPFKVNAKYPDGAPVPTVPANLLVSLPQLPEPLQYRIIDKHLILVDEDADVILDYALNVIR